MSPASANEITCNIDSFESTQDYDRKTICISRGAWQALQEFKHVFFGLRSYSGALLTIRSLLGSTNEEFLSNLSRVSPLPAYLLDRSSLSRNSRKAGRSKTVVLSSKAWNILLSVKDTCQCKSLSEAILFLYHTYKTLVLSQTSASTLSRSVLSGEIASRGNIFRGGINHI